MATTGSIRSDDGETHDDHDVEIIRGTKGDDVLVAGGGPQTIYGDNGRDAIYAGGGPDTCLGDNGDDSLFGQGGPDTCYGGNGNDLILGESGPDRLFGGNGDDVLTGGPAADVLEGGRGADTFVYIQPGDAAGVDHGFAALAEGHEEPDHGSEVIVDFQPGADTIDLAALPGSFSFIGVIPDGSALTGERVVAVADTGSGCTVLVNIEGAAAAELEIQLLGVSASALGEDDFLLV
jgi:Ca2+-binding RTX toxin-like protein